MFGELIKSSILRGYDVNFSLSLSLSLSRPLNKCITNAQENEEFILQDTVATMDNVEIHSMKNIEHTTRTFEFLLKRSKGKH